MASNANSPTESTTQQALGREYAIMLGAQPLSGLASLINWTNSSSYRRPTLEPWGHIATSDHPEPAAVPTETKEPSGISGHVESPSKAAPPEAIAEVVPPVATPTIQPSKLEPELTIAESVVPEVVVPEVVVPEVTIPEATIAKAVVPEVVIPEAVIPEAVTDKSSQPSVEVVSQEPVAKEVALAIPAVAEAVSEKKILEEPKPVVASEPVPVEKVVFREAEQVASVVPESIAVERPLIQSEKTSQIQPTPKPTPKPLVAVPSDEEPVTESRRASKGSINPSASEPIKTPPIPSAVVRPSASPQRLAANSMPDWKPTAKAVRPPDSNSSGDEYLRQLERLIIELNMELGMREGDSPSQEADQMSLLVQRMIDLNLQNLALKEQLREAGSPTI